jgi:peptidoglycan-N-acetylglucosamine deacetylase
MTSWPDGARGAVAFTFDFDAAEVFGYRSPSWELTAHSMGLLQKHGFRYSSNFMDDVRPYRHQGSGLVELPTQWLLDDAAHFLEQFMADVKARGDVWIATCGAIAERVPAT